MRNRHDFSANVIIDSIQRVCVNETIADPKTRFHGFGRFAYSLKRIFLIETKEKVRRSILRQMHLRFRLQRRDLCSSLLRQRLADESEERRTILPWRYKLIRRFGSRKSVRKRKIGEKIIELKNVVPILERFQCDE